MSMQIRKAELSEASFVAELMHTEFTASPNTEILEHEILQGLVFVAQLNQNLVGCADYSYVLDEGDIGNILVLPENRRQGIGEALLLAIIEEAKNKQLKTLILEVRTGNAGAIALYEKYGFKQIGRRPGYYEKPREDALILQKEL